MRTHHDSYAVLVLAVSCLLAPVSGRADIWRQTTWEGGAGQDTWSDSTMYFSGEFVDDAVSPGALLIDAPNDGIWYAMPAIPGASEVHALAIGPDGVIYAGTNPDAKVYKSTDKGRTWTATGELTGAGYVFALAVGADAAIYAGTGYDGDVYRSTNGGATWSVTGDLAGAESALSLFAAPDGTIYAGTRRNGDVFKTTNSGTTWTNTGNLSGATNVRALIRTAGGILYAGTRPGGKVFTSTDDGASWTATADLSPSPNVVRTLLETSDGSVYAGASSTGDVFKTTDGGASWNLVGDLEGASYLYASLQAADGSIYVTTSPDGRIFKSTDQGASWLPTGTPAQASDALSIVQDTDHALYVGILGANSMGRVVKAGYFNTGTLVSSIFHAENASVTYGALEWQDDLYGGGLEVKVRTDTLPDMTTAVDWSACPPVPEGLDISGISSVEDGAPYVQYRIELTSPDVHATPVLREISLHYDLDLIPPGADSALASDNLLPGVGIDEDDEVRVYFDEPTDMPQITASVIDQVLRLSGGHSWRDGSGGIGGAFWSPEGDVLLIRLSTAVSPPTVSVGDTVTLDGTTISDRWGNASSTLVVLGGSFDPGSGIDAPPASGSAPRVFSLSQNFPNPFNPMTEIAYEIPAMDGRRVPVELLVFDARGRVIRRFPVGEQGSGRHSITWNGTDERGSIVSSGVYFYLLRAGDFSEVRKMLLVR